MEPTGIFLTPINEDYDASMLDEPSLLMDISMTSETTESEASSEEGDQNFQTERASCLESLATELANQTSKPVYSSMYTADTKDLLKELNALVYANKLA